jgi:hypothetical protein
LVAVGARRGRRSRLGRDDLDLAFDEVEAAGYDVNGIAARRRLRSLLRKARDSGGQPLVDASTEQILGATISYVSEAAFADPTLAVVGDYSLAVIGVRQDLTYKLLDQAVITDDAGAIVRGAESGAVAAPHHRLSAPGTCTAGRGARRFRALLP